MDMYAYGGFFPSSRGNGWNCEYGMSQNAVDAYEDGKMPKSKWSKQAIISRIGEIIEDADISPKFSMEALWRLTKGQLFDAFMRSYEWHHTSGAFNKTLFYEIDVNAVKNLTDAELENIPKETPVRADKTPNLYVTARVSYSISRRKWRCFRQFETVWVDDEIIHYRSHDKLVETENGRKRLSSLIIHETASQKTRYPADKKVRKKIKSIK